MGHLGTFVGTPNMYCTITIHKLPTASLRQYPSTKDLKAKLAEEL